MRSRHILVSAIALALLIGAAPDIDRSGGRYTITPADNGAFLRLDTETGTMSVCQRKEARWVCEAVPDDRRALEGEIERLATENKELQSAVKRLEELLTLPDADGRDSRSARRGLDFKLPSEADVDRMMDYVQGMVRKFKDRLRDFKDSDRRSL